MQLVCTRDSPYESGILEVEYDDDGIKPNGTCFLMRAEGQVKDLGSLERWMVCLECL